MGGLAGEKYGAWFLYALFAAILVWEQCWRLEQTAYLSSCLLLLITAGAVLFSWFFERRYWCRYRAHSILTSPLIERYWHWLQAPGLVLCCALLQAPLV